MNVTIQNNPSSAVGFTTNFALLQGETVAQQAQALLGVVPINLTGYTIKSEIATPTPILLNTSNGGIIITDAVNGKFVINIPASTTAGMPQGTWVYDLFITSASGVETALFSGNFIIQTATTPVP